MTMNFFYDCKTDEEIKKKYRDLSKKYHPDLGGDESVMKEINLQYESCKAKPPFQTAGSSNSKTNQDGPQFYGAGFGTYSKYKTYRGQEFADRFKKDAPKYENYGDGIPLNHPIRGLVNQLEERLRNLQNHINHITNESNDWQRKYQEEFNKNKYKNFDSDRHDRLKDEYNKMSKKYDSLKKKYDKIKPTKLKKRRICETEPNVENVIAL